MQKVEALSAALGALTGGDQRFAQSLISQHFAGKKPLSQKQLYWVDKLTERASTPKAPQEAVQVAASFAGVQALFAAGAARLKRPKIRLALDTGAEVHLSLAGKESKNPGFIYVRLNGDYVGKISPAGEFNPYKLAPAHRDALLAMLAALGADPAAVAAAYGKATGSCCFCSITLTDARSTTVGYGPICAGHYDLPWGETN